MYKSIKISDEDYKTIKKIANQSGKFIKRILSEAIKLVAKKYR